jgi:hypothetical protein
MPLSYCKSHNPNVGLILKIGIGPELTMLNRVGDEAEGSNGPKGSTDTLGRSVTMAAAIPRKVASIPTHIIIG